MNILMVKLNEINLRQLGDDNLKRILVILSPNAIIYVLYCGFIRRVFDKQMSRVTTYTLKIE